MDRRQAVAQRHTVVVKVKLGASVLAVHGDQDSAEVLPEIPDPAVTNAELVLKRRPADKLLALRPDTAEPLRQPGVDAL